MADPIVWGTLPKSQDDPQTIAEAIADAVSGHNNDPESHMSTGQSIENHRVNDVVDHPVGSVLADKNTMSEIDLYTQFENLTLFGTHGSPYSQFPGFKAQGTSTGYANRQEVYINGEDRGFVLNFANDWLFQFSMVADTYPHGHVNIEISNNALSSTERGVGLEIIDSVAKFYVAKLDGSSKSYLTWPTYEDVLQYIVRMQYVASEGKVYFYINGELLGSLDYPDTTASDVLYMKWEHYNDSGSSDGLSVYACFYSLIPNS